MKTLRVCGLVNEGFVSNPFANVAVRKDFESLATRQKKSLIVSEVLPEKQFICKLGRGGFACVNLVKSSDEQLCAQKIAFGDNEFALQQQLLNEVLALLLLEHEGILDVYEAGSTRFNRGTFTMPYIKNAETLDKGDFDRVNETAICLFALGKKLLREREQFFDFDKLEFDGLNKTDYLLDQFRKAASAVEHIHDRGIIHRDLKPANILVSGGKVFVIDFGCATINRPDVGVVTTAKDGYARGTNEYMAPENFNVASQADATSDIYSLVVTLYECLTGKYPFSFKSTLRLDIWNQLLSSAPRDIRELNPEICNKKFAKTLLGALDKDPKKRPFRSIHEFKAFLNNVTSDKLSKKKVLV